MIRLRIGKWRGSGRVPTGNSVTRAAVSAMRCNPPISALYQRLRQAGKPAKVALTACMRKLLVILNAIVRSGRPWDPAMHG